MVECKRCFVLGKEFGESFTQLQSLLERAKEAIDRSRPIAEMLGIPPEEFYASVVSEKVDALKAKVVECMGRVPTPLYDLERYVKEGKFEDIPKGIFQAIQREIELMQG